MGICRFPSPTNARNSEPSGGRRGDESEAGSSVEEARVVRPDLVSFEERRGCEVDRVERAKVRGSDAPSYSSHFGHDRRFLHSREGVVAETRDETGVDGIETA